MIHEIHNGIRVVTIPVQGTNTVSVGVFVNVGSGNESPSQNGISHFLEHMAFKGTSRRSYTAISQDAERLGADINAFTDIDMTAYHVRGLPEHAPMFIDILGDIFCNSLFDEKELEQERNVILQEYAMYEDYPSRVADALANSLAYPGQAEGKKIIGEPKNIKSFTRNDLVDYVNTHYRGSNVLIGVCGKFDEHSVLTQIKEAFKDVESLPDTYTGRKTPQFHGGIKIKKKSCEQCSVVTLFNSPNNNDPDHYAYEVAAAVLGGGMSSPLFDEIREKRGLAYGIGSSVSTRSKFGQFEIKSAISSENLEEYLIAVQQVIGSLSVSIKDIDMERAKNSIIVSTAMSLERPFNKLLNAVGDIFDSGNVTDIDTHIAAYNAVSQEQVKKILKSLLTADRAIGIVGSKINMSPEFKEKFNL